MTKRKLEKDEREFTEKNLTKQKEKLQFLQENKDAIEAELEFSEAKRKYNDRIRNFTRKAEDMRFENQLKSLNTDIKETEDLIEVTEKQLTEGVEVKQPTGV